MPAPRAFGVAQRPVPGVLLRDGELALAEMDVVSRETEDLAAPHAGVQGRQHRAVLSA